MLNKQGLHTLLNLDLPHGFPKILVYSEKRSERLSYVCDFIFKTGLKLDVAVTNDLAAFTASGTAYRINYSGKHLEGIFQVQPQGLLFENTLSKEKPVPVLRKGLIYFYAYDKPGNFPYDIFSSVFYFISRYEEWQEFEKDRHGRFEAKASVLYPHNFHMKPVVDIWIGELAQALKEIYPDIKFPERTFEVISTIDVDNLFAYKAKGLVRTLGAAVKDLLKLDLKNLRQRLLVLSGKKKDPFDVYEEVSDFCFEKKIPLIWFFLFRSGTAQDRTVDPASPAYLPVFKTLKENHALFGLHPSYESSVRKEQMQREMKDFSRSTKEKITLSRQHYLRFDIRTTPDLLLENGIEADFTMGFASAPGFRAGTSQPFYYYDFKQEKKTDLLFIPFCVMDGVYTVYEHISPGPASEQMLQLAKEVKAVDGLFISVFHERTFSDHLYAGFGSLYKNLHSTLKEL